MVLAKDILTQLQMIDESVGDTSDLQMTVTNSVAKAELYLAYAAAWQCFLRGKSRAKVFLNMAAIKEMGSDLSVWTSMSETVRAEFERRSA